MSETTDSPPGASQFYDLWLPDYCPSCNPAGTHADSRVRQATLTEPDAVTWHGGKRLVCEYFCVCCGHRWRRGDLWTAENAGFAA